MGGRFIIDIESNGLLMDVTKIWCIVIKDIDTGLLYKSYDTDKLAEILIQGADLLIGHNITMYDLPVLRRLLGIDYSSVTIFDTLLVSRLLLPDREQGHSLNRGGKGLDFQRVNSMTFPGTLTRCLSTVYRMLKLHIKFTLNC